MKHPLFLSTVVMSVVVAVSACAPITKQSIKQDPAYSTSFSINQPYQQVFDTLLKKSQHCYLAQPSDRQLTLVGNRDNGKKTANITLEYVYAMAEHDVILMLDMVSVDAQQTQVQVYSSRKDFKRNADIIEKWLVDEQNELGCA